MNKFLTNVFLWMFAGLLITFATGYYVSTNPNMIDNLISGKIYLILAIIEIVLVIVLSARVSKMNPMTAKILFLLYSFVTGLTFSSIFVAYKLSSIVYVFAITASLFLIFAALGYLIKLDLSKLGTYLFMGLIGILICSVVNIFVGSSVADTAICCLGVVIFVGYTAYDVSRLKQYELQNENYAILGALQLYLDFINIFIYLLRLFGKSDD